MGLKNFILTCEKDNEELRKNINYYKNMVSRLKKENQELKDNWEKLKKQVIDSFNKSQDIQFLYVLQDMQKLEQGSDINE
jgi:predicted RNase H-like nuclease (RuvC/YqgF family)